MNTASWSHIAATDLSICLIMQLTKPFNAHSSRWIQFRTCKADVGVEYVVRTHSAPHSLCQKVRSSSQAKSTTGKNSRELDSCFAVFVPSFFPAILEAAYVENQRQCANPTCIGIPALRISTFLVVFLRSCLLTLWYSKILAPKFHEA
jgi:hypothetical protein